MSENTTNNPCWSGGGISLRKLIQTILRWWWLIIATTVVSALAVFLFVTTKPVQYEAKAVLVNCSNISISRATIASITNEETLLHRLYDVLNPMPEGINDYETLTKRLSVEIPRARSVKSARKVANFTLTATAYTASDASRMVNTWAKLVIAEIRERQHADAKQDNTTLQTQFTQTRVNLTKAEDALVAARIQHDALSSKLAAFKQKKADYLAQQQQITGLLQEVASLHEQFSSRQGGKAASDDNLAVLTLFLQAAGSQPATSMQIASLRALFSGDSLDNRTRLLENMQENLQGRLKAIGNNVTSLDARILSLQETLQKAQAAQKKLNRSKQTALTDYENMAWQLEKLKLERQLFTVYITVAKPAEAQLPPLDRRRSFNTVLAGIVGLMAGIGIAFVIDWWQSGVDLK